MSERPLRIGIDATSLASRRGYGRYLRELLPPLLAGARHEYILFADEHAAREIDLAGLPARVVRPATSASQAESASARGNRRLGDLWSMGRAVARARLDLVFFPTVYSYFPVLQRVPIAVAFHDTIPERHGKIVFPTRARRLLWNAKVALARRQARGLLTVSEWSRRRLCEQFGTPPERVFVTGEAPSAVFRPADDAAPLRAWLARHAIPADARYLVYVGGFNPHKNLALLLDALRAFLREDEKSDLRLVLVGDYAGDVFHADVGALRARIERLGLGDRVHFPGFVADEDLRHVYAGALAAVLPSLEEGFGLPAVEAAACGTPCLATDRSPLPALLEGGGLFADPGDATAWSAAIARVSADPALRQRLAARALERARALSWDAAADAARSALETIARLPA